MFQPESLYLLSLFLLVDYLPFLNSNDEIGEALDARAAVNKLIAMGAACAKAEEAIRERYDEEERIVLRQYAAEKDVESIDDAYQQLVTDLLEAEERELERTRTACVTQQREYLRGVVQEVLEYYSFLMGVDPTAATAFLEQAGDYWESIRLGLEECQQLYSEESDGLPPEVFSEEKMCRTEEVELLLEAFQSFFEQAALTVGKVEDTPLEGYLPGVLPAIPGSGQVDTGAEDNRDSLLDLTEVTEGPTEVTEGPTYITVEHTEETMEPTEVTPGPSDVELYLPGILPVIPDWPGSGHIDDLKTGTTLTDEVTTEDSTEATEGPTETTESPTEATESPTETTESPTEATEGPTETTEGPTETTESPTEATEGLTETTESRTETTESPTETTESPTETTEDTDVPLNVEEVEKNAMPKSPEPGYYDNSESVLHNTWCDVCKHGLCLDVLWWVWLLLSFVLAGVSCVAILFQPHQGRMALQMEAQLQPAQRPSPLQGQPCPPTMVQVISTTPLRRRRRGLCTWWSGPVWQRWPCCFWQCWECVCWQCLCVVSTLALCSRSHHC